jgi:hypothetical protein
MNATANSVFTLQLPRSRSSVSAEFLSLAHQPHCRGTVLEPHVRAPTSVTLRVRRAEAWTLDMTSLLMNATHGTGQGRFHDSWTHVDLKSQIKSQISHAGLTPERS